MKVPTNDLVPLDAEPIELGARAIEAQLVRRRGSILFSQRALLPGTAQLRSG